MRQLCVVCVVAIVPPLLMAQEARSMEAAAGAREAAAAARDAVDAVRTYGAAIPDVVPLLLAQTARTAGPPSAEARAAAAAAKDRTAGEYSRGSRALDRRAWDEAVRAFGNVAQSQSSRADGALYWKAYALNKLGRRDESLSTLAELQKTHPQSRWLNDAKALEVEVRNASGKPVSPEAESDEELKLLAMNSLLQSDPERMLPMVEKMLKGSASPRIKEQALFVLAQSNSSKARDVLAQMAKGAVNPDLQMKAIQFLAIHGGKESSQVLADVFASSKDESVRLAVLNGYMVSGQKERILSAAKSEQSPEVRRTAIHLLGAMGAQNEIWQMYQGETSSELKLALMQAMMVSGMSQRLLELAKADKDPNIRRRAIELFAVSGGAKTGDGLVALYQGDQDRGVKEAVIHGLMVSGNARQLVEIARKETDRELKKKVVQTLSVMHSPEASEYLMELLNK